MPYTHNFKAQGQCNVNGSTIKLLVFPNY